MAVSYFAVPFPPDVPESGTITGVGVASAGFSGGGGWVFGWSVLLTGLLLRRRGFMVILH